MMTVLRVDKNHQTSMLFTFISLMEAINVGLGDRRPCLTSIVAVGDGSVAVRFLVKVDEEFYLAWIQQKFSKTSIRLFLEVSEESIITPGKNSTLYVEPEDDYVKQIERARDFLTSGRKP